MRVPIHHALLYVVWEHLIEAAAAVDEELSRSGDETAIDTLIYNHTDGRLMGLELLLDDLLEMCVEHEISIPVGIDICRKEVDDG